MKKLIIAGLAAAIVCGAFAYVMQVYKIECIVFILSKIILYILCENIRANSIYKTTKQLKYY